MDFLAKIAKALGLEDADEEKVLEALTGRVALDDVVKALELDGEIADTDALVAAVKAKREADEVSLEDRAKAEGKELVSKTRLETLEEKAEEGVKAAKELKQAKFDAAYEKALDEVRVDGKDETRQRFQKLYDQDSESTLELLGGLAKIASTEPRGKTGKAGSTAPEGVDADRHELNEKVEAYVRDNPKVSYVEALEIVAEREEAAV